MLQLPSSRLCKLTYLMHYRFCCKGKNNWASQIENMLCRSGIGYVCLFQEIIDVKIFLKT